MITCGGMNQGGLVYLEQLELMGLRVYGWELGNRDEHKLVTKPFKKNLPSNKVSTSENFQAAFPF